jgi:hypothetical protein
MIVEYVAAFSFRFFPSREEIRVYPRSSASHSSFGIYILYVAPKTKLKRDLR